MQREGLVQPFRQTAGRRLVPVLQLAMECLERRAGLVVLGTVVGAREALAPGGLLLLGGEGFVRLTLRAAQYRDAHSTIPLPSASLSA